MRLGENGKFLVLMLGVFSLTLGVAVLVFALIARVFFEPSFIGRLLVLAPVTIMFGLLLLLYSWRRSL